jgi:glycosyltransferase involved in cell wall biosynthesis
MAEKARKLGWLKEREIKVIERPVEWRKWQETSTAEAASATVLFVGRIEPRKAPEMLVEAIKSVRKEISGAKALFAGRFAPTRDGKPSILWAKGIGSSFDGCEFLGPVPSLAALKLHR